MRGYRGFLREVEVTRGKNDDDDDKMAIKYAQDAALVAAAVAADCVGSGNNDSVH